MASAAHETSTVPRGLGRFIDFRPGHTKFDYSFSIEQQRPDVVVQLWEHREQIMPYLRRFYTPVRLADKCVYLRTGSSHVLWDRVTPSRCDASYSSAN